MITKATIRALTEVLKPDAAQEGFNRMSTGQRLLVLIAAFVTRTIGWILQVFLVVATTLWVIRNL